MDIGLILKVAGVGVLVAVAAQILSKSGKDEQAMLVTVAGVIVVMIMLSAYFSASEIAFNSANKMRLRRAAEGGSKHIAVWYMEVKTGKALYALQSRCTRSGGVVL